jgi:hypothetical protein
MQKLHRSLAMPRVHITSGSPDVMVQGAGAEAQTADLHQEKVVIPHNRQGGPSIH